MRQQQVRNDGADSGRPDTAWSGGRRSPWGSFGAPRSKAWISFPIGLLTIGLLWSALAWQLGKPYLLPSPASVLGSAFRNGDQLAFHAAATLQAVVLGFAAGFSAAVLLGYTISRSALVERAIMPYLIATQAIPVIAVAPLLLSLPTSDLGVKVIVAALTVFFPMLINTVVGLRSIEPAQRDLMQLMSASRWQQLRFLELPAALPVLLAGMRVGITLSVIGAVVGEFVKPQRGLGVLIRQSQAMYNTGLTFAALLSLVTLALGLYGCAALLERLLLSRR